MDRVHTFKDGTQQYVPIQLRCQGCGKLFVEAEREFCDAPPVGPKLAAQKARALQEAKRNGESFSPREAKLIKAIETIVGPIEMTAEQKEALETQIDYLLRQAWADAVFAFKSGKGPNPGGLEEFKKLHREEVEKLLAEAKGK
jgi:hypothetical protein